MKVYVVTNPEEGWDCVIGVFLDIFSLKSYFYDTLECNNDAIDIYNELTFSEFEEHMMEVCPHLVIHEVNAK